jgi:hypothetical protein
VKAGAGGLIDSAWCLDAMAPVIAGLPGTLTEETVTRPELLVHRGGPVEVYYTPFDWVNTGARIVLIGICPGRRQMLIAVREARRVLVEGGTVAQALAAADATASFAGPTRSNLVQMLDNIGVPAALGISSSASLFGEHQRLADSNSMCNFTVQVNGQNYRGSSPRVREVPFLRAYVTQVLAAALDMMPDALVVPLGKAVSSTVTTLLVKEGRLDPRRCLLGFPHPSGANGHRPESFRRAREDLTDRVRAWFGEGGGTSFHLAQSPTKLARTGGSADADTFGDTSARSTKAVSGKVRSGNKGITLAGTSLNSHQLTNVHALLVNCPYCGAEPGEPCLGAKSHPDGYRDQLHKGREEELDRRLDAATADLTRAQDAAVRRLFVNPQTAEERRAVMTMMLRPGPDR